MCEIDSTANNDAHFLDYFLAKIEFNLHSMGFKGTMSPVTHARDGARSLESVRQTILILSGESFSVFIELYLSHPCEVGLIVVCASGLMRSVLVDGFTI